MLIHMQRLSIISYKAIAIYLCALSWSYFIKNVIQQENTVMNKYGYIVNLGNGVYIKGVIYSDNIYEAERHLKESYPETYPYGGFNLYEL